MESRSSKWSQCRSILYNGCVSRMWPIVVLCASALADTPEQKLTIVYDNTSTRPGLKSDWGFSALVDFHGQRVLFDVGSKPDLFLDNLKQLGIEKSSIQANVISHDQAIHSGGIFKVLPAGLINFLDNFSKRYPEADAVGLEARRGTAPAQLGTGIYSTGEIAGPQSAQSQVIDTSTRLVIRVSWARSGLGR